MADKKRGVGEEGGPTFGPRSYQDGRQHIDIDDDEVMLNVLGCRLKY